MSFAKMIPNPIDLAGFPDVVEERGEEGGGAVSRFGARITVSIRAIAVIEGLKNNDRIGKHCVENDANLLHFSPTKKATVADVTTVAETRWNG